eukprot:3815336-Prymnesium_polylepis.1
MACEEAQQRAATHAASIDGGQQRAAAPAAFVLNLDERDTVPSSPECKEALARSPHGSPRGGRWSKRARRKADDLGALVDGARPPPVATPHVVAVQQGWLQEMEEQSRRSTEEEEKEEEEEESECHKGDDGRARAGDAEGADQSPPSVDVKGGAGLSRVARLSRRASLGASGVQRAIRGALSR